jgi:hypothetical protein
MNTEIKIPFNTRAFVALISAISGAGLPFTGLAIHLLQKDPVPLERHIWTAAHSILGIIFMVFAIWHVILNRRVFLKHAQGLANRAPAISREAVLAITLVGVLLFLAVGHAFTDR